MEAVETPSLFTPSPNSEGSHCTCTLRITYDLTLLRPYPRKLSQSTEKAVSQRPREGWVSGWVSGWHGYLLSALGRLALALVVQDALDQMVVLIQHLKGREAHASHTAAGSHPGRQDPWGVCWGTLTPGPRPLPRECHRPSHHNCTRGSLHLGRLCSAWASEGSQGDIVASRRRYRFTEQAKH